MAAGVADKLRTVGDIVELRSRARGTVATVDRVLAVRGIECVIGTVAAFLLLVRVLRKANSWHECAPKTVHASLRIYPGHYSIGLNTLDRLHVNRANCRLYVQRSKLTRTVQRCIVVMDEVSAAAEKTHGASYSRRQFTAKCDIDGTSSSPVRMTASRSVPLSRRIARPSARHETQNERLPKQPRMCDNAQGLLPIEEYHDALLQLKLRPLPRRRGGFTARDPFVTVRFRCGRCGRSQATFA